ncbi:hypothetical protein [Streptomyces fradiae]|uniref:HEAT repeat domain-containing protein n=1 Tax=Streptomyces fradiae TaxID=1906 RepID=UPI003511D795
MELLLHHNQDRDMLEAAFSLAVRAHAGYIAQLLVQHGADPGECGPDALVPLGEAVDCGSPGLVEALLDHRLLGRYSTAELREARELARRWREAGAEAELRRRTGCEEAPVRARVRDDEYCTVGELALGGMTVRDGHGAILTRLEELLGIRASFEELMARALEHDQDHSAWWASTSLLGNRREEETWAAALALRTHPDPAHRLFGAGVLRLVQLFDDSEADAFAAPALELFVPWAAEEADLAVLIEVLIALGEHADARAATALLAHAGHPDARVRHAVANGLGTWPEPSALAEKVREALLVLMDDGDPTVRREACRTVGWGRDRTPVLTEAMAALLDDADRRVQLVAVEGLALHHDDRCVEAARRLGPPRPGFSDEETCLGTAWRYKWRRDGR